MLWINQRCCLLLTLFAGLATGVGSVLALLTKTSPIVGILGFSAGVMLYVSFAEILVSRKR